MKNKIITVVFLAYIFIFAIGGIIVKDRSFSDLENRELEQFPKVSAGNIFSGEFSDKFETYMSDQIVFKDFLMKLKVSSNRVLGQTLVSDVYFGEDDMLIKNYVNPYNQLSTNLNYINAFADANPDFEITWLIAPNSCYIYEDRLPAYASCYDQQEVLAYIVGNTSDKIKIADCSPALMQAKNEYIYYNTDHHWTAKGAYIGYSVLCDALNIAATPKREYDITVASDEFYGTLYSGAPTFTQKPDSILLYQKPDGAYRVEYADRSDDKNWEDSLYSYDNLNKKDKYTVYLDGNHSYVKITSNSDNEEKLLVVKDSYAHCLLPLLADNFSEIHVVDLRYYHKNVSDLAREHDITKIVFINNIEFLSTDNNFLWLW
ncbi:MAG: DHHW family protein [Clostridium sp.]|nr:DHHW family protein [Clostridium sp.]MCM1398164.1 DHHW family protein [Clostridium sp.]MCM1461005.1 DHHW family protein [Bacteroides sp.]